MTARILCVAAVVLGAGLGSCLPVASQEQQAVVGDTAAGPDTDVPLEIAISYFPGGYQGRWASSLAGCTDDPENSKDMMSLQGKLVKLPDAIGTMTSGKRQTSKSMEAEFDFIKDDQKWSKTIAFAMSEDRKRLKRTDKDDGRSYQYVQCPKLMAG
jgi:hypothetical protein